MVRAAIVGLGWRGRHIVRRMRDSKKLKLVAALETSGTHAAFAAENGLRFTTEWNDVLCDPSIDAVVLCTSHSVHTRQVLEAAAAGKHVFCEKPLALSRREAELSVEACRAAGVMLGIGHERRFEPAAMELRRMIRDGGLGTIVHVEASFSHDKLADMPETDWRASSHDAPSPGMTAMGIHLTDLYVDLFGPITEVFAQSTRRVSRRPNGDVVSVQMRFASGATGYLNTIMATPLYIGMTVFGSEARVEIRNHTHPDAPGPTTLTYQHRSGYRDTIEFPWEDAIRANLEAFAESVASGAAYPFTDAQKIANIATLEAIYTSAAGNVPVRVASPGAARPRAVVVTA